MDNSNVLEVTGLNKSFGAKKVIDDVSFKVCTGDVFGFLGPNGAGKTTIIRIILMLVRADSGIVKINGYDTKENFGKAIQNVGAVVETPSFYAELSGYQNLAQIKNLYPELPENRISEVLEVVGLNRRAKEKVKTYSLGMKQRLGIARALLNHPKLVFLDEPTNGLDPQGIIEVREMVSQLAVEQDITFFITTHLLHEVEQVCNKAAILHQGKIVTAGKVKDLLNSEWEIAKVYTREGARAAKLIEKLDYIRSIRNMPNGIEVEMIKGHSGRLVSSLVSEDVMVDYVVPKEQSLERLFIQLTQGGDNYVELN